ncbi:MAG: TrbC/VirB2 family protein, partial [Rickettsiales bacterium]|nr:TrbC/VirB2 family protein [Rickettsiales bacterium]
MARKKILPLCLLFIICQLVPIAGEFSPGIKSTVASEVIFKDRRRSKELTNEELVAAKRNGVVSAICFVMDLMSGRLARAIIAVAMVGVGWIFLVGGMKWTNVVLFTLACSLVFGGMEIANIISGNNYSCESTNYARDST